MNFDIKNVAETQMVWPSGKQGFIGYCDGVFDDNFCSNIIDLCESNAEKSKVGKTLSGVILYIKNSLDWSLDANYDIPLNPEQEMDYRVNQELQKVVNLYRLSYTHLSFGHDSEHFGLNDSGYQVQKYEKNIGFYNQHIDGALWIDSGPRTLAALIYLNTVDYGGGTQFPVQDVTIDAVAGRVALFPAYWTHPHSGLMPLSSDKWIISTFLY
jgi:hypothetical protein